MSSLVVPAQVWAGKGVLEEHADCFRKAGKKALVISGKVMEKIGNVKRVTDVLEQNGQTFSVFTGIEGEPTDQMVTAGVRQFREDGCDFLAAVGGGSPIDTMKAISVMLSLPGELKDYMGKEIAVSRPVMIAIPTTAGTGSEATWFTIISDTSLGVKMFLKGKSLLPDTALIDSTLSMTQPASVTAATGLDALTHVVEGYTSRKATALTDPYAVAAAKMILRYLPEAFRHPDDEEAREKMSLAALYGGIVINNSSVTLVHGMSRPVGALFHVPHGLSNAMLMPACLGFALDGAYDRFASLARAAGAASDRDSDEAAARKLLDKIGALCEVCKVPSLQAYGIERETFFSAINKMAQDAYDSGSPSNTRKEVTVEDMKTIYRKLWE